MRKWVRGMLIVLGLLAAATTLGFLIWGSNPLPAMSEAEAAMISDAQVTVEENEWLGFSTTADQPAIGLIFYPGAHVDYRAYAPPAHQIAAQGYLMVIVQMPLNLAVLDIDAAADVIAMYPEIQHWVIGGHSLGGAMAANFANNHPETVEGLALWASYPGNRDDLSVSGLRVASISATLDGLATMEKIAISRPQLPQDTRWVVIQGGNHAQFGWYGDQPGDNPAAITREEQQEQVIQASVELLESIR
jgi:dienelactone hydrolase